MSKLSLKKQQKKDALFASAFELFTGLGLDNTSISDITKKAGVAKGTFYLYFKDKLDIRNRLIARKAGALLEDAINAMDKADLHGTEEKLLYIVDHMMDDLQKNPALVIFMSKNLSWGLYRNAILESTEETDMDFKSGFYDFFDKSEVKYKNPEVLIFMIAEFISGVCNNSILYSDPLSIEELKPYLHDAIVAIMRSQQVG